jgi:hypothetical protein
LTMCSGEGAICARLANFICFCPSRLVCCVFRGTPHTTAAVCATLVRWLEVVFLDSNRWRIPTCHFLANLSFGCGRDDECSEYANKCKANGTNHFSSWL